MRDFLNDRADYLITRKVSFAKDLYNDKSRLEAVFLVLKNRSKDIDRSLEFLSSNIDEMENTANTIITSLKNKISYLTSSTIHLNKLKLEQAATSKEGDIKLVDLSDGEYTKTSYSHTDNGIVMTTISSTTFRDR